MSTSHLQVPNPNAVPPENTVTESERNKSSGRCQNVFVRNEDEINAMAPLSRIKCQTKNVIRRLCCKAPKDPKHNKNGNNKKKDDDDNVNGSSDLDHDSDDDRAPVTQYRLEATNNAHQAGFLRRAFSCCCCRTGSSTQAGIGIKSNQRLASTLHWMFRVNFIFLFAVMCSIFFVWVMIFAGFIIAAGRIDDQCVRVGGEPFSDATSQFADAFSLSWTTFSTVGYGSTYPALGHENDNPTNCLFITVICSLESFLGVLYSGFCGAILFGKVLRIQSHAQVIFSDPLVIRYGSGVQMPPDQTEDDEETGGKKIPCPVLEFRVVNRLFGETGGEIMDATLNCVANVDANDTDPSLRDALENRQQKRYSLGRSKGDVSSTVDSASDTHSESGMLSYDSRMSKGKSSIIDSIIRRNHQTVDEDPSARLVNKRIFSKMTIEAGEHPFFKRVWLGRHVLDDTSPILKPKIRRQIRRNQGYWPEKLNNYESVRESIQFNQILVSLNGVSNVSASDVYAQKIYDFVDINIGYQFVNLLYKDSDGALKVDTDLINDVRQQRGPDSGEPLILASD